MLACACRCLCCLRLQVTLCIATLGRVATTGCKGIAWYVTVTMTVPSNTVTGHGQQFNLNWQYQ